jgi:hypothetical protein
MHADFGARVLALLAPRPSGFKYAINHESCPQWSKVDYGNTIADDGGMCSTSLKLKLNNVEDECTAAAGKGRVRAGP